MVEAAPAIRIAVAYVFNACRHPPPQRNGNSGRMARARCAVHRPDPGADIQLAALSSFSFRLLPLAGMAMLSGALTAQAADLARVASPDGTLAVIVESQHEGRLSYRVERNGEAVIAPSRLGMLLGDGRLERNIALSGQSQRSVDETWEQPWGERRLTRNHYNELRTRFSEKPGAGRDYARQFDVVFRVHDDGVGFRYEFP